MQTRALLLIASLPLALLACGPGGGLSGGPVEPPPPDITANIVASSSVTFGLCTGPGGGCYYTQEYTNTGPGCANSLHATVRAYQEDTLLASDNWWLDSTLVIQPGEHVEVEDCCFDRDTVQGRTRTATEIFWNNVPCS